MMLLFGVAFAFSSSFVLGWTSPLVSRHVPSSQRRTTSFMAVDNDAMAQQSSRSASSYQPLFDFSQNETIDKIERIDDAIMGGISTSTVANVPNQPYARWFGVCRTDGGGFCGFRSIPFREPLQVGNADGFYVTCRLTSDNETNRRVWKMTTRTKPDRGELLYQAPFVFQQHEEEWSRIKVPFSSFKLVRGPRMISNGPPFNTTGGLYQIGFSMSKFKIGEENLTELENFRPGFFELQMKDIGLYKDQEDSSITAVSTPEVYSKEEAKSRRPLILKMLLPVATLFFSEQSQRRKSAMKILRQKRGLSRGGAILFGLKSRARSYGMLSSLAKTFSILAVDAARACVSLCLRISLLYPIRLIQKTTKPLRNLFNRKPQTQQTTS